MVARGGGRGESLESASINLPARTREREPRKKNKRETKGMNEGDHGGNAITSYCLYWNRLYFIGWIDPSLYEDKYHLSFEHTSRIYKSIISTPLKVLWEEGRDNILQRISGHGVTIQRQRYSWVTRAGTYIYIYYNTWGTPNILWQIDPKADFLKRLIWKLWMQITAYCLKIELAHWIGNMFYCSETPLTS